MKAMQKPVRIRIKVGGAAAQDVMRLLSTDFEFAVNVNHIGTSYGITPDKMQRLLKAEEKGLITIFR